MFLLKERSWCKKRRYYELKVNNLGKMRHDAEAEWHFREIRAVMMLAWQRPVASSEISCQSIRCCKLWDAQLDGYTLELETRCKGIDRVCRHDYNSVIQTLENEPSTLSYSSPFYIILRKIVFNEYSLFLNSIIICLKNCKLHLDSRRSIRKTKIERAFSLRKFLYLL